MKTFFIDFQLLHRAVTIHTRELAVDFYHNVSGDGYNQERLTSIEIMKVESEYLIDREVNLYGYKEVTEALNRLQTISDIRVARLRKEGIVVRNVNIWEDIADEILNKL